MFFTMSCVFYQESGKSRAKVARISAQSMSEAVEMLYKGLNHQEKTGKRFLNLSKGAAVWVQGMDKSGYLTNQKICAGNWTAAQMRQALAVLVK
jgi:hypothetical protein